MSLVLQIFAVILCIAFLVYIVYLVKRNRLLLRYSLLWILFGIVVMVAAIWPDPIYSVAWFLGFKIPANFIFLVGLFLLAMIALSLTSIVSRQTLRIKDLNQKIALIDHKLDEIQDAYSAECDKNAAMSLDDKTPESK